jgi:hypothetical protein
MVVPDFARSPFLSPRNKKYCNLENINVSFGDMCSLLERSQEFDEDQLLGIDESKKNNGYSKLDDSATTVETYGDSLSHASMEDTEAEGAPMGQFVLNMDTDEQDFELERENTGYGVTVVVPSNGCSQPHYQLNIAELAPKADHHHLQGNDLQSISIMQASLGHPNQTHPQDMFSPWRSNDDLELSCRSTDSLELARLRRGVVGVVVKLPKDPKGARRQRRNIRREKAIAALLKMPQTSDNHT